MEFIIYTAKRPEGCHRTFFNLEHLPFFPESSAERYVVRTTDPDQWGKDTIRRFNATLRSGERPIVYLGYDILDPDMNEHDWEKSCLVTQKGGFDTYRCKTCGITGKRHGLRPNVVRDTKYAGDKYKYCKG